MLPPRRSKGDDHNTGCRLAFTLVEVLIVILLLSIVAGIVMPEILDTSYEARESALMTDLQAARRQIELYTTQHRGRAPHLNEDGKTDTSNFVTRMISRTDSDGKANPKGPCGPYLLEWPENPFVSGAAAAEVKFGKNALPPRDGKTGWYYSTTTGILSANSTVGAESLDPSPELRRIPSIDPIAGEVVPFQ